MRKVHSAFRLLVDFHFVFLPTRAFALLATEEHSENVVSKQITTPAEIRTPALRYLEQREGNLPLDR